jgi:hypothetical protein
MRLLLAISILRSKLSLGLPHDSLFQKELVRTICYALGDIHLLL